MPGLVMDNTSSHINSLPNDNPFLSPSISFEEENDLSDTSSEVDELSFDSNSTNDESSESSDGDSEEEAIHHAVRIGDNLRLSSGRVLSHRSQPRQSRRHEHPNQHSRSPPPSPSQSPHLSTETINLILSHRPSHVPAQEIRIEPVSHKLVIRKGTETSLLGIPEKQQRAMLLVAKKMEATSERTMNEYRAGLERRANCQKTFRVKSIGKKAGGLEKRLG